MLYTCFVPMAWRKLLVCCAVLCCAVLCCAVLCCAVLCCAVLCCAVLCCAVLCCAVLFCARARSRLASGPLNTRPEFAACIAAGRNAGGADLGASVVVWFVYVTFSPSVFVPLFLPSWRRRCVVRAPVRPRRRLFPRPATYGLAAYGCCLFNAPRFPSGTTCTYPPLRIYLRCC